MQQDVYPKQEETLNPKQAMERMRWCNDRDDIYVLNGGIEKRMSTLSQQYRAISLMGALIDDEKIVPDTRVVIIGAGIAGLTAAAVALSRACTFVELYEKRNTKNPHNLSAAVAATFENSNRLIDPRLYEWPIEDWVIKGAELSLLDWKATEGSGITGTIRDQWEGWMRVFGEQAAKPRLRLYTNHNISPKDIAVPSGRFANRDIIKIVAVGFGQPRRAKRLNGNEPPWVHDHWSSPPEPASEGMQIGVVGSADGGLTEAIEHALLRETDNRWLSQQDLRGILIAFDNAIMANEGPGFYQQVKGLDLRSDTMKVSEKLETLGAGAFDQALTTCGFRVRQGQVLVFVRTKGDRQCQVAIDPKAFLLNRWLAAQLRRLGALRLVPCKEGFADEIVRHSGGMYVVPTHEGRIEVDRLFVRIGTDPVQGWKDFIDSFVKSAKQRSKTTDPTWKEYLVYEIARRSPPPAKPGTRYFYSDFYDSPTQRAVLDALLGEGKSRPESERELVRLYERRFLLEVARRDRVLLSDNQVFEGAFFLRWLPQLPETVLTDLLKAVRIGTIRVDSPHERDPVQAIFDKIVANNGTSREFEFSAILDGSHRKAITEALKSLKPLSGILDMPRFLSESGVSPEVKSAWNDLASLHSGFTKALNLPLFRQLLWQVKAPYDLPSALEDPGAFAREHAAGSSLVEYAFGPDEQGQGRLRARSPVYTYLDEMKGKGLTQLKDCIEPTRDWYDRAYARAIGFQHAQAAGDKSLVFETVHTQGLPTFYRRDGKPESKVLSAELLTSDDRAFLLSLRASWVSERDYARVRAVSWHDRPKSHDIDKEDLGQRALALLRGSTDFVRLWTEEASQVGPRVPAVIDEEYFGGEQGVKLNRVEYFGDINP